MFPVSIREKLVDIFKRKILLKLFSNLFLEYKNGKFVLTILGDFEINFEGNVEISSSGEINIVSKKDLNIDTIKGSKLYFNSRKASQIKKERWAIKERFEHEKRHQNYLKWLENHEKDVESMKEYIDKKEFSNGPS